MSGSQHLLDLLTVDTLFADDDKAAAALFTCGPRPIVIVVHAATDGLHLQPHRLGGYLDEALDTQDILSRCRFGNANRQGFRIGHGRQIDDEAVEVIMLVVKFAVMVGAAVFNIVFDGKAKADQHGRVDGAIGGHDDLCRLRQMAENMRLGLLQTSNVKKISLCEHDEIGAGDLILENLFDRVIVVERFVIGALGGERLHVVSHLALGKCSPIHHGHHGIDSDPALDGRPLEGLYQRLGQGETRGLDENVLHLRLAAEDLFDRRLEIIRHRAADAAIGQLDDVFLGAAFNAAAFKDFAVNADVAELVDDDGEPLAVKFFEKAAQQRGFASPQKAGNDGAGNAVH
ncbi:hypothetical protein AT6N2_C2642 [Agrobacterium tumefaciens]|nr:hypothetical protein AT6N2_C2642 [Agrobacterium tumefaciens]